MSGTTPPPPPQTLVRCDACREFVPRSEAHRCLYSADGDEPEQLAWVACSQRCAERLAYRTLLLEDA